MVPHQFRHGNPGTGSFDFRFQLSAPKSIPEPAVIQLEVYLVTWPPALLHLIVCHQQECNDPCTTLFVDVYGCLRMFC